MRYLIFGLVVLLGFSFGFAVWFLSRDTALSMYNNTPIKLYKQYKKVTMDPACPVKGSASKIYHLAGDTWYDRLKPAECFADEAAALAAGFRKAGK